MRMADSPSATSGVFVKRRRSETQPDRKTVLVADVTHDGAENHGVALLSSAWILPIRLLIRTRQRVAKL
jgi:hypothetical protein